MLRAALVIAGKDLRLVAGRGGGLVQALLLGLLLIFVFSLSKAPGETPSPQAAAAIFWLASAFCQVLLFNALYALEETHLARVGLILSPAAGPAVWLGKLLAGLALLLAAQAVFLPAAVVFLGLSFQGPPLAGLAATAMTDVGLAALGSLLAGVRIGAAVLGGLGLDERGGWWTVGLAFDALFLGAGLLLFPFVYSGE